MIILDTSALSMVFRRHRANVAPHPVVGLFRRLIDDDEDLRLPGVVLQEMLSGVRDDEAFVRLSEALSGFPLLLVDEDTHLRAARIRNACRGAGIAAASFDCLIAAHTLVADAELLTLDDDFSHMAPVVGLRLRPR